MLDCISPQQRRCVEMLARGLTDVEIAALMRISIHTVRNHLKALSARLGISQSLQKGPGTRVRIILACYDLSPRWREDGLLSRYDGDGVA